MNVTDNDAMLPASCCGDNRYFNSKTHTRHHLINGQLNIHPERFGDILETSLLQYCQCYHYCCDNHVAWVSDLCIIQVPPNTSQVMCASWRVPFRGSVFLTPFHCVLNTANKILTWSSCNPYVL